MIVKMLKMRLAGVEVPKRRLHDRYNSARPGKLEVVETTDQGLHRLVKLARFTYGESGNYVDTLFDVNLLWYRDGRMVLSGLSAVKWICNFATMLNPGCVLSRWSRRQCQKAGSVICRCADYSSSFVGFSTINTQALERGAVFAVYATCGFCHPKNPLGSVQP